MGAEPVEFPVPLRWVESFFNSTKAVHHWSKLPRFPGTVFCREGFFGGEKWVYIIMMAWNKSLQGTNIKRSTKVFFDFLSR